MITFTQYTMGALFKSIWGIWAAMIFSISLFPAGLSYFLVFLFAGKRAPHIAHKFLSRKWAGILLFLYGIRLKILHEDLLDPTVTYVFVANHRSQLDIPAYALSCHHVFRFLAKMELSKIPLLGYIIRKLYISVDRSDKAARARSMDEMMQSLREGASVFICPEGTRNKTSAPLLDFREGAFRLAITAQVPLAVLVVQGSDKLLSPLRPIQLKPGTITCTWIRVIPTTGMNENMIPPLKEEVMNLMTEYLKNSRSGSE